MDVNRRISIMREQSKKRKRLLAQMVKSIKEFRESLGTDFYNNVFHWGDQEKYLNVNKKSRKSSRIAYDDASDDFFNKELPYKGTSTFLKGTRSCNPHNDYSQHFVDTGQRPQNFIRDVSIDDRFGEYPKLRELIRLKDELIATTASPPMYLKCDLHSFELKELKSLFDVILIEPPLEEYQRTMGATNVDFWSWQQRSFVFLWCGSSEGLDMGRACLRKWGFRRCEDICWIRTNLKNPGHSKNLDPNAIFQRTKEHCLMGIKGTVRRSVDGDFIHANVDIDLIISEENECGSLEKPTEIFCIIEHFCLGRRRLHVFGRDSTIRPGWLTVGPAITSTNFSPEKYGKLFTENNLTTGCTDRIETLRPKSPPLKGKTLGLRGKSFNRGRR